MIKIIGENSIYMIGKVYELKELLSSIEDKSISVAEYIQRQACLYAKSLN
ncbi:MAG: hypothetical protein K0R84_1430 [Clostridia bacterium]|jgi:hypothetical protein|nr:hypothetical protein [Clostridia bacterium]